MGENNDRSEGVRKRFIKEDPPPLTQEDRYLYDDPPIMIDVDSSHTKNPDVPPPFIRKHMR